MSERRADGGERDTQPLGPRQLLRRRDYRLLWASGAVSAFGDNLTALTLLLLINDLTGSASALATMAIAIALPQVLFGLLAGVYVDRLDRQRVVVVSSLLRAVVVLGFITVT